MSREDIRFLKIVDESAQLQDGHYSLKMPFRKDQLTLPNNLSMVKQRLLGLKGKFRKDELFHKEYTSFFADASQDGFGTVTYLRIENSESRVHVSFLLGKARITPLKPITIPCLELTAAVLAVRVDQALRAELELPLDQSTFWTDSTAVLKYIKNEDKRFQTFVANRVSTIRDATHVSQWRYINTKDNPADYASRGMKVGDLLNVGSWIEGPKFLFDPEKDWPSDITEATITDDDLEVKRDATVNTIITQDSPNATDQLMSYFSDWRKLKVAVAWFLKWKRTLLQLKQRR